MKTLYITAICCITTLLLTSCFHNNNQSLVAGANQSLVEGARTNSEEDKNPFVNAVEQAKPTIMIIPGDRTLQNFRSLKVIKVNGSEITTRNYADYLLKDDNFTKITASIQDAFTKKQYPLTDFEQTLKSLDTKKASDIADNLAKDAKTQLLCTARPDIVLDFDYTKNQNLTSHDYTTITVSYTLKAIDAYTNKVVSSITGNNLQGESISEVIIADVNNQIQSFMNDISTYFSDILANGREVIVRINVGNDSNVKLTDDCIEGDSYSDELIDYMKAHTIKGAYTMQINTAYELSFTSCRIRLLNDDGTQYGVYDFTRDLKKYMKNTLGLKAENNSQGLGEVVLTIKGI